MLLGSEIRLSRLTESVPDIPMPTAITWVLPALMALAEWIASSTSRSVVTSPGPAAGLPQKVGSPSVRMSATS